MTLSVLDTPVSDAGSSAGATGTVAAESTVTCRGAVADDMLPRESVNIAVTDQVPSGSPGRSHEAAGSTYEHETTSVPFVAVIVTVSPDEPPDADMVGVVSFV